MTDQQEVAALMSLTARERYQQLYYSPRRLERHDITDLGLSRAQKEHALEYACARGEISQLEVLSGYDRIINEYSQRVMAAPPIETGRKQ